MSASISFSDGVMTVALSGEIDHHSAVYLRESIDSAAERQCPKELMLDFSRVGFMDSSGIGLIMGRYRLIKEMGGSLVILGASANIKRVIKLAGLERLGIVIQ